MCFTALLTAGTTLHFGFNWFDAFNVACVLNLPTIPHELTLFFTLTEQKFRINGFGKTVSSEVESSSKGASTRSSTAFNGGEATPRVDYNEESLGNKVSVPSSPHLTKKSLYLPHKSH